MGELSDNTGISVIKVLLIGAFAELCNYVGWRTLAIIASVFFWIMLITWVLAVIIALLFVISGSYDKLRKQKFRRIMEILRWV